MPILSQKNQFIGVVVVTIRDGVVDISLFSLKIAIVPHGDIYGSCPHGDILLSNGVLAVILFAALMALYNDPLYPVVAVLSNSATKGLQKPFSIAAVLCIPYDKSEYIQSSLFPHISGLGFAIYSPP